MRTKSCRVLVRGLTADQLRRVEQQTGIALATLDTAVEALDRLCAAQLAVAVQQADPAGAAGALVATPAGPAPA